MPVGQPVTMGGVDLAVGASKTARKPPADGPPPIVQADSPRCASAYLATRALTTRTQPAALSLKFCGSARIDRIVGKPCRRSICMPPLGPFISGNPDSPATTR